MRHCALHLEMRDSNFLCFLCHCKRTSISDGRTFGVSLSNCSKAFPVLHLLLQVLDYLLLWILLLLQYLQLVVKPQMLFQMQLHQLQAIQSLEQHLEFLFQLLLHLQEQWLMMLEMKVQIWLNS